jgi:phosphoserine phosphatase
MLSRRLLLVGLALALGFTGAGTRAQQADPLPSWNEGPAKQAILELVRATTEPGGPGFVTPEDRLATFDQDGTLWVEHPIYSQVVFALDRVVELAPEHPEWRDKEPFKTVLSGDREAMAKLSLRDLEEIVFATHAGMTVEAFDAIAAGWAAKARDHRWRRPYTELVYQPMLEVLALLRDNGYRTYIVTGGGQAFVRSYAGRVYGVGPSEVIGSTLGTKYGYDAAGEGVLIREPKLQLDNNNSGKAEDIYLFTGERPRAAFGNSTGDRQMLEWATGGGGGRLGMLVLHDDAAREYAYGPAAGLPDTKVGTFTQALHDEATKRGWTVISMRTDWKTIFPEPAR